MSNSSLISYVRELPHTYGPRTHEIDEVAVHCVAGNLPVETVGDVLDNREVSSTYGIGSDGRIALFLDESLAPICTSSESHDNRAITIEVANCGGGDEGWPITEAAYESLIALLVDICKRNPGIPRLRWQGDKNLIGQVDKQNMIVHRWFAAKACPGDYLYAMHYDIAKRVNDYLSEEDDEMSKIVDQIAKNTGLTEEQVINRLSLLVGFQDVELDQYQTDGVNKLKELGLISTARDGRAQMNWGDAGTVIGRLYEKTK